MGGLETVRRGPEQLRVGPWRGDGRVAYVAPVAESLPVTATMVNHICALLRGRGYVEVVTGALATTEQPGFLGAGFDVREELHLLVHDLERLPPAACSSPLRRARHGDRVPALGVDGAAFPPFWHLDKRGLDEALGATPSSRFRVATATRHVVGYAVSGRAGHRGYLQRLAVTPSCEGRGIGRALVVDGLRWMKRKGVSRAVVNTQFGNDRALHLYTSLGFRVQPSGLAVLTRRLEDRQPAR